MPGEPTLRMLESIETAVRARTELRRIRTKYENMSESYGELTFDTDPRAREAERDAHLAEEHFETALAAFIGGASLGAAP